MTADITQDRIAELRGQHTPSVVYHDKKVCPKCSYEEYPCTMLALLDALEAERGLHALDHSLADRRERERDQLRAENERLRAALEAVWASGKVATEGSCYPKELCEDCLLERQVMAALAASPKQEGQ